MAEQEEAIETPEFQDPAEDVVSEAEALRAELAATQDRLLRAAAEFQNFRRRTAEERRTWTQVGKEQAVEAILGVFDDLSRSVEAIRATESADDPARALESLRQGVELIHTKFAEAMSRIGVEPIEAKGQPFDEEEHEALMKQPAPEGVEPGTVLAEIQKGYRLGDRILRHPQVVVAE